LKRNILFDNIVKGSNNGKEIRNKTVIKPNETVKTLNIIDLFVEWSNPGWLGFWWGQLEPHFS